MSLKQTTKMGTWKARIIQKMNRGSQTPGIKKGIRPTQLDKFICRSNRSYKHAGYSAWNTLYNGGKVQRGKA